MTTDRVANWPRRIAERMQEPVDSASLNVFRMLFGLIMLIDVIGMFLISEDVRRELIAPDFHFKFHGFEWVHVWPGDGLFWHVGIMGVLAILIAVGLFYRIAIVLFGLGLAYVFLLEETVYLNHVYLVLVVNVLLMLVPAHRGWSVDALRRPGLRQPCVPRWSLWVLRLQFEVVLIYAGLVKINADWLHGEPLRMWLDRRVDLALIGPLYAEEWAVMAAAYGVIALHLIGAPLLLWRRTRLAVFCLYATFHLTNHFTFNIGIFPWFTIAGTLLFFEPSWPRSLAHALRLRGQPQANVQSTCAPFKTPPTLAVVLSVFMAFQILFPLRHFLYPGNVAWTEEGHRFAWRMKLRDKEGYAAYTVTDPASGKTWRIRPRDELTERQYKKMVCQPDMILQYAHHLAARWAQERGMPGVEVRAQAYCSLNGRPRQALVDPNRDLAKERRKIGADDWILPLTEPLRRSGQG